jgi:hypothetical protein
VERSHLPQRLQPQVVIISFSVTPARRDDVPDLKMELFIFAIVL